MPQGFSLCSSALCEVAQCSAPFIDAPTLQSKRLRLCQAARYDANSYRVCGCDALAQDWVSSAAKMFPSAFACSFPT